MGPVSKIKKLDPILDQFRQLRIFNVGGSRAPNKPLLVLLAIGRCLQGHERLSTYASLQEELKFLLDEFGPFRKRPRPEYPFWRLRNDSVWEIDRPELVDETTRKDAKPPSLIRHNIRGGFPQPIDQIFRQNPASAMSVVSMLLHSHFPATLHAEILRVAGISAALPEIEPVTVAEAHPGYVISRRLKREEGFRRIVLKAYESRCAVCEFAVKLEGSPVALEAAHIKWHQASGPSESSNGLLLCALHHKLFDKGVFTLLPRELKVIVTENVSITDPGFEDALGKFHEKRLNFVPRKIEERPAQEFVAWHTKEVFKSRRQLPAPN